MGVARQVGARPDPLHQLKRLPIEEGGQARSVVFTVADRLQKIFQGHTVAAVRTIASRQATSRSVSALPSTRAEIGWPAACFLEISSRHVANRSRQAMIVYSWRPTEAGLNVPRHLSLLTKAMGSSAHSVAPFSRCRSAAAILSCPSQKISASTSTASPSTALAEKRPPSNSGETASIAIRSAASSPHMVGHRRACRRELRCPRFSRSPWRRDVPSVSSSSS